MADGAVEVLLRKVVSLLEKEASLLGGVRLEFNEMKRELESMKSFLSDADKKGANNQGIRTWVGQVRDITYDVEDIIDEFMYHVGAQGKGGFIRKIIDFLRNLGMRRGIASKLHDLNKQIKAISERSRRYQFDRVEPTSTNDTLLMLRQHAESSHFIDDGHLVGIEEDKDILLRWLTEGESQRAVMSVCGMGGSGKTTLVSRIYKNQAVKQQFDCFAWITVTQSYNIQDLFRSLIREFFQSRKDMLPHSLETLAYIELLEILLAYLQTKQYLVILDDVWSINLWTEISIALPEGGCRSKIILTTRNEEISCFSFGVGSSVHYIQPLQEHDAWALFCKTAFSSDPNNCCPKEVTLMARLIVARGEGLPLAIVAIGGLMSRKSKTDREWRRVYDSLNWELDNNPTLEVVKCILLLSYNDLSHNLRHCFLYCSIFPEDHFIRPKRLFRLWIAEGFVGERRGITLEKVAETYLMELVSRNMIQFAEKIDCGRPTVFRMHDLMRDLALSISERENFSVVCDERAGIEVYRARRLSIHKGDPRVLLSEKMPQLRSFFIFVGEMFSSSVLNKLPSRFRLLRVLDLQGVPIERLPDELTELFNLRYLNLRDTLVKELPKSLGRLQNLQTLDLRDTGVATLPKGISKLQNLRHLVMYSLTYVDNLSYDFATGAQVTNDIWKLKILQVLNGMETTSDIVKQIGRMTQLTKTWMLKIREAHGTLMCTSIQNMKLLHTLSLMAIDGEETLCVDDILSAPPLLRRLSLVGKLVKVPIWLGGLYNLNSLYLRWSQLKEDPLPYIHDLPNLCKLYLINAYNGSVFSFRTGKFPKLQYLSLSSLPELNEVIIEKGALPGLQVLDLISCKKLKMVPQGIEHLITLEKLYLGNLSEGLIERLRGEKSIDHPIVQHIREIDHHYSTTKKNGWFYENLSLFSVKVSK